MEKYISFEKTKAGYYIFCKLKYSDDDYFEAMNILKKAKVSVVP
jgi:aspartate/methionine/tyrosine aminotransferase